MTVSRWVSLGLFLAVTGSGAALAVDAAPPLIAPGATLAPPPPPLAPDSVDARLQALINGPIAGKLNDGDKDDINGAKGFYSARNFAPLWVDASGLTARAKLASVEIARADDWGLTAADFVLPAPKPEATRDELALAELTMTRAVLKYGRFARGGRIPDPAGELSGYIDRKPQVISPQTLLEQIAAAPAAGAYLSGLNPRHPQFENLRRAYLKARAGEGQLAKTRLEPGPVLMPGKSDPRVGVLRTRLSVPAPSAVPGGLAPDPAIYDAGLVAAVKSFQTANGLRGDAIVGDKTRAALNAGSGQANIPLLLANMEQWRWMPVELGNTYVQVNIPEFQMRLVMGGNTIHTERVVTGKADTSTPIFSQAMETVVFQPKWGVPDSIKINELLPRLQSGGGLRSGLKMAINGREIDPWRVDWSRADITRYQVYQPSGDDNALGVVKFLFPNRHSVYLHDTPSKSLFNASMRAYSHGCIRLRNPVRLAELVLGADKGWDGDHVRGLVEDGPEDNPIKLDTKIPVHVTYFTAVADESGHIATYPDVYGHERRITQALAGRTDLIAKLDPPPLGSSRGTGVANGNETAVRRRSAESRFEPPSALGFAPPPPSFSFFSSKGAPAPSRGRGESTNDMFMRSLRGY